MSGENGRNDMSAGSSSGSPNQAGVLRGIILDEQSVLTLTELSHVCAVQTGYIIELVDEGLVTPDIAAEENEPQHWRFSGAQIRRARTAIRLQSDLGVNLAGAALALQLLDEIENLRAHVRAMDEE
jgi:chaperone modulatory protein CbpM